VVFEWNPASMRFLEKAGYICDGRLKKSVFKDDRVIDQFQCGMIQRTEGETYGKDGRIWVS
jgi:RimJ/RimL family protein N-acetyltransferase